MEKQGGSAPRLWERTRQAAHAEIIDTAMRLFLEHGFDVTTIDQIAAEAGISRRSFFRYFGTKEDIVLGNLAELGLTLKSALEARPAAESPWQALRAAFAALPGPDSSPEHMLKVARLLLETPSLRARQLEKHLQWQELLVPDIEKRLGADSSPVPDPRAPAIVSAALVCLDVATATWIQRNGEGDLGDIYDQAVAAVRG